MSNTGLGTFDQTVQQTNEILDDLCSRMGWSEQQKDRSYTLLRVVLQTLRDRMPVNDAANFGSQLPMLIRGIYYEGWDPSDTPIKMEKEEFMRRIQDNIPFSNERDFNTEDAMMATFEVLSTHLNPIEFEKIASVLPKDIAQMISASI